MTLTPHPLHAAGDLPRTHAAVDAQPFPCCLPVGRTALVIIDMQNQFCAEGGFAHMLGADIAATRAVIPAIGRLLARFRALGCTVIHTREGFLPDLSDCPPLLLERIRKDGQPLVGQASPRGRILIRGDNGCEIIPELAPAGGEIVIDKPGVGTFVHTALEPMLRERGIDHLIVTGVTSDMCVQSFIREANDRGFNCVMVTDACAAFDSALHDAAIRMTTQQGAILGWAASTESVLRGLEQSPGIA